MLRFFVRSRRGNLVLAVIGGLYAVAALTVLGWFMIEVWSAADTFDHVLQFVLLGAGACGLWLLVNALENLGRRQPAQQRRA
jgi:membrane protein DedA with SNARE-associated domain